MALSLQRLPSLSYFEENLAVQRDDPPVMVEHPGEVILEALNGIQGEHHSGLTIIPTLSPPEYGFYLTQLEERFGKLEIVQPASTYLIDILHQAAGILEKDPSQQVVVSETTQTGTSAIALASSHNGHAAIVKLIFPDQPEEAMFDFELAGFSGDLEDGGTVLLERLIKKRSGGRPVSLVHPGHYNQPPESLLTLIMIALAIKAKTLPAWNQNGDPELPGSLHSALHLNPRSRPWLARGKDFRRSAALLGRRMGSQKWRSLRLIELSQRADSVGIRHIDGIDPYLFLISADDQEGMIEGLEDVENILEGRISLKKLAGKVYAQYYSSSKEYTCCLLAATREELQNELNHAKIGVKAAIATGNPWTSPAGSYFTAHPFGKQGIAFVYPGAFNSYPGMAQGLFFNFPGLQDAILEIIPDLSHSLAEQSLYFPDLSNSSDSGTAVDKTILSPAKLIESGICLSVIYTKILEEVFDLKPEAAFGYSLGETSMLWANQVWQNGRESSDSWNKSNLFRDQLTGKMDIVRNFWQDEDLPEKFWGSYILKDKLENVVQACAQEERVSITIQNAPEEIVIAGEKRACERIIQALGCHALPMPIDAAIHHPAMGASLESFRALYDNPTNPREDIRFYSAAEYGQLVLTQNNLARSMSRMTCNPVDFPRLVNQVYKDRARIFIEVGPQRTCSRWIEKILRDKPHAVIPINKKYQADLQGIFKVISLLVSHGAALDLSSLFQEPGKDSRQALKQRPSTSSSLPQQITQASQYDQGSIKPRQSAYARAFTENLDRISLDMAESHSEFLNQQASLTRVLARVMTLKSVGVNPNYQSLTKGLKALFSHDQIKAFTNGDHRICFGDQFSGFGDRRIPRLPNGPLQMIDRVMQIQGEPGYPHPGASLSSEYDLVPGDWFLEGIPGNLPLVALLEIALQPCGFLSAYIGSIQGREDQDLYFRNLDGEGLLMKLPDPDGPAITNQVKLVSSSSLNNIIIQKFNFELSQDGSPFFLGSSSFGYFPLAMLMDQDGLDGGRQIRSWFEDNPHQGAWQQVRSEATIKRKGHTAHLPELHKLWVSPNGGSNANGYIYLEENIPENAWFYNAHFFQDPVMPGSLGVETMARSLMAAAFSWQIPGDLPWRIKPGSKLSWKFRGQITPDTPRLAIDLHIKHITRTTTGWEMCADGQLWKDSRRLYQVENLCLESLPSA